MSQSELIDVVHTAALISKFTHRVLCVDIRSTRQQSFDKCGAIAAYGGDYHILPVVVLRANISSMLKQKVKELTIATSDSPQQSSGATL